MTRRRQASASSERASGLWTLFAGTKTKTYRGPDRRGVIEGAESGEANRIALGSAVAVIALPFAGVGLVALGRWSVGWSGAWTTGAADAAFVGFLAVSGLLLVHWRLVGQALSVPFATAAALVGLFVVPTVSRVPWPASGYPVALREVSVALALGACIYTLRLPEVRAGLSPVRFMMPMLAAAPLLALGLAFSPARVLLTGQLDGFLVIDAVEAAACVLVSGTLLVRGSQVRRTLYTNTGVVVLSAGGACAALSDPGLALAGAWANLPALFLLAGAVVRLVAVSTVVRSSFERVVLHDMRGRRRWQAAEDALGHARFAYQGQSHDINSMLSAVDGTLLVLANQRDLLPAHDVDRLMGAVREQVHAVRDLLAGSVASVRPYDLSHLLSEIVAIRATAPNPVVAEVEAGLELQGHPERLAVIIGNLLANAAAHAPEERVLVTAKRQFAPGAEMVEIAVSDHGPGLADDDLERALERGWRGEEKETVPGSGLGLYQCRELAEAEGGSMDLRPTDPQAAPGRRGLTARVLIPVRPLR